MTHSRAWAVCAALVLLAACGRNEPAQLIDSAKAYLAKQDYAAAAIQLKSALQREPTNGEARYLLGVTLNEEGDFVSAEKELRRALEYQHPAAAVVPELAKTMSRMGEAKKLVAEFGATRLDDPAAQASLQTEIGFAYIGLGQLKEARAAFAVALAARPGDPRARAGEARVMAHERNLAGAMKVVDDVLAQSPAQPEALGLKAELLLTQNQLEPAKQTLGQLIQAQPTNAQARFALVSLLIEDKRFDQARTELEAMKRAVPRDVRSRYLEALLELRQGDPTKAKEAILHVLKVAPDHAPSQLLAGAIELQLRAYGTAEDHLRKVLARQESIVARRLLAATYLGAGQPAKADEVLEAGLRLAPDDPVLLRLVGEAALAGGDFAKAAQYYEQAAARDKDNAAVRTRLGQARLAGGDVDQAFKDLEAASTIDPDQYQADLALVLAHVRRREYDQALAAVGRLEKKQPTNPLTFNLKGAVYLAKGDRKNSRASFERALELKSDYLPAAANLARLDLAEQQPQAARKRFESIVTSDPKNEQALLALAEVLAATSAPLKDVIATVDRAVAVNPRSVRARLAAISVQLNNARDPKAGLAAAQAANAALPENREILAALGRTQVAAGEPRQAVTTFNKLAAAMPESAVPLMLAARAHVAAKDYEGATQALRKALTLQPDRIDVHRDAIAVLLAAGKPEDALADARALQKARPNEAVGYMFEAEVLVAQKRYVEAARAYAEASKRQPSPLLVTRQHFLLEAAGKPGEGDAVAARWLQENPKDVVVRLYLAERDLRRKDYKVAARRYREVLALQPENPVVLNNLGWTLSQLGDPSAVEYAEKAYRLAPDRPAIADTLGWMLVERGDVKRGVELLSKAAADAPNALQIRLHYAKALIKSGDKAGARRELEHVRQAPDQSPLRAEAEELLKQL